LKRKTFIILLAAVVVLGGIIGGAFAGGMAIGKSQGREEADQEWQNQFSQLPSRFGEEDAQPGTTDPGVQFPGGLLGRGGTVGEVEKVEGNVLTLSTLEGTIQVLISDSTTIQKMEEGVLDNILPGDSITVSGERNEDGSIEATNIFITPSLGTE